MPLIRQIAQLGHPVLREPARPAALPASEALRALAGDMLATLLDADGVGIAAPQVYEGVTLFLVASRPNPRYPDAPEMEPEVVVNPEVVERSGEIVKGWEGCLSIPGIRGEVPRHRWIRARYRTPLIASSASNRKLCIIANYDVACCCCYCRRLSDGNRCCCYVLC